MSRKSVKNFLKQVKNPYPTESQSYTAWEKGFVEGFDSSEATMTCFEENDLLEAFNAGQQYCATEGKIYPRSPSFNEWKQSKKSN